MPIDNVRNSVEPLSSNFRISYGIRGEGVERKYFKSAEAARKWLVEHERGMTSYTVVEQTPIPFERLVLLAQLERECEKLGCE